MFDRSPLLREVIPLPLGSPNAWNGSCGPTLATGTSGKRGCVHDTVLDEVIDDARELSRYLSRGDVPDPVEHVESRVGEALTRRDAGAEKRIRRPADDEGRDVEGLDAAPRWVFTTD